MKSKSEMIISFKTLEELGAEAILAAKSKKTNIQAKNIIYFESWTDFRGFMTLQKIEILAMIANAQPKSIYELTQLLKRSLASVQKDCEVLKQMGFIKFERKDTGRGSITPKLIFDYDKLTVKLPKHPYILTFKAAS